MTGLDPEARALIDLARAAEDGSNEDRIRVRRKVAAALGLGAAGLAGHEVVDSGVQSSMAPLAESRPTGNGLSLVERASGEMAKVTTFSQAGGLAGSSASLVLHAAAFLVGGALLGGAAWLAVGGAEPSSDVDEAAVTSPGSSSGSEAAPSDPLATPASNGSGPALVPQPETPRANAPIRPEDLPILPNRTSHGAPGKASARRVPSAAQQGPSLADEARELALVHEALREGKHAIALSRLDAMDRRSGGVLGEERLVARVLSLCGLSRVGEAEAVARQVQSVAPESPLLPRLGASCAKGALDR